MSRLVRTLGLVTILFVLVIVDTRGVRASGCTWYSEDPNNGCECFATWWVAGFDTYNGFLGQQHIFWAYGDQDVEGDITPEACAGYLSVAKTEREYNVCYYDSRAFTVQFTGYQYWLGSLQTEIHHGPATCCGEFGLNCH